jgi:putative endopeptidase
MMRITTITLGLLITLAACNQATQETKKDLVSGLDLNNVDSTARPGDNFFRFVNGKWIDKTEIPSDKPSYGVGYQLYEKAQENVKQIIEDAASSNPAKGTDEQKVGDLFASYLDMDKRNALGAEPLKEEFARIDAINDLKALSTYFGYGVKYGYDNPFALFIESDLKKPEVYALYIFQGGLGLPEREYYLDNKAEYKDIRQAYVAHITKMMELAGLTGGEKEAKDVLALETKIAGNHIPKEETRDMNKMYNMRTVDSVDNAMKNVDWKALLQEVGMPNVEKIVVGQPTFIAGIDKLIGAASLDTWKTYLKWQVTHANAGRLNADLDKENFSFYGTKLNGTPKQPEQWRRAVNTVNNNLGEVVGKIYVGKHFPPEAKERMLELVGNLTAAYEVSIKELDWMSAETKMAALDKLSKFTSKIGYPDKWKDYSALQINRDDLYGNLRRSTLVEHERQLAKFDKPVDKSEWLMTPQTINAYYNPPQNEIAFPAAILQAPYFNMDADDAVNYGAIGGVIGHEIGHGFDDQGSAFDGNGVLRDWWTDSDKTEFKKRTSALVEQYNSFEVFDDLNVNGEYTLGENIGDLGGLSIALKAYKMSLNGKEEPMFDGLTGTQRVFLGWAQAWRGKSREEALRVQVGTDPHSPGKFRVNGVVRNIPEFYDAFDIKPGDSLYLEPEKRVKIW